MVRPVQVKSPSQRAFPGLPYNLLVVVGELYEDNFIQKYSTLQNFPCQGLVFLIFHKNIVISCRLDFPESMFELDLIFT